MEILGEVQTKKERKKKEREKKRTEAKQRKEGQAEGEREGKRDGGKEGTEKTKKKKLTSVLARLWKNWNTCGSGNVKWCNHYGKQYGVSSKTYKLNYI